MGKDSYNVELRTHTQKKSFLCVLYIFCNVCNGKSAYLPSKKKPPSRKYAKSKYHQSLLHATEPQARAALEHSSYF